MLISRLPNVGSPPKPVPEMLLTVDLQRQRHVVVVVRARRDVDVDADVLVVERRDRLLVARRRSAIGANVVTGTGTRSPNRACAGDALPTCAAAGWPASACSLSLFSSR